MPACLAGFQAHTQGGSLGGSGKGGLQAHTKGEFEGDLVRRGLQAYTQGGSWRGSGQGGLQAHTQGICSWGCLVPGGSAPGGCGALPLGQLLLWTVCILLECIFVFFSL